MMQNIHKLHIKSDLSHRLALCGIWPQERFVLLIELTQYSSTSLCKMCLKEAQRRSNLREPMVITVGPKSL